MASYRGGLNSSTSDGGDGYARGSYRGGASNYGAQGDDNAAGNSGSNRGGAHRGGYGQRDNSSSGGEGFRGGRGGYSQRDENQSGSSGYRGGFSRGGGAEGYGQSRGGAFRGATEGQSYRGSAEGYRGSNRGAASIVEVEVRLMESKAEAIEVVGVVDTRTRDIRITPTEEEKARLAEWDATPVTKPSPFTAFKKPSVVESAPPKQPEPIVKPKVDELVIEAASTVHGRINVDGSVSGTSLSDKLKNQIGAGMEIAKDVVQPSVIAAVSVTIDKEVSGAVNAIATGAILNKLSKVLAGVENVVDVMKEPILEDSVKHSTVPPPGVALTGSASGFVCDLTRDDLVKLAEICGAFKDAFTKLHELVVSIL
uniref:Uncharacterized protein n=1 Tax=Ditylenchus dipsaci TaxID=166011 RepID=A0A915E731_9BILA